MMINIVRQFTMAPLAISIFGNYCYEKQEVVICCYTLKIPVITGNFTKKKIHFEAFLTILFRVKPDY